MTLGIDVHAIDESADAVSEARKRGVPAVRKDFLKYEEQEPFDVILFSRSLHHIKPITKAVAKAFTLLTARGRLVLEDFAYDAADRFTISWFDSVQEILHASGVYEASKEIETYKHSLELWQKEHGLIHPSTAMMEAVNLLFVLTHVETAPYLYRNLIEGLEKTNRGARLAQVILKTEKQMIKSGMLKPLGLRIIARKE